MLGRWGEAGGGPSGGGPPDGGPSGGGPPNGGPSSPEDHQTQTEDHQTDQQHPHQHSKKPCHRGRRFIGPAWKRASLAVQWEIGQSTMSKRFVERSVFGKKKSRGGNARRQRKLQQEWQRQ